MSWPYQVHNVSGGFAGLMARIFGLVTRFIPISGGFWVVEWAKRLRILSQGI